MYITIQSKTPINSNWFFQLIEDMVLGEGGDGWLRIITYDYDRLARNFNEYQKASGRWIMAVETDRIFFLDIIDIDGEGAYTGSTFIEFCDTEPTNPDFYEYILDVKQNAWAFS